MRLVSIKPAKSQFIVIALLIVSAIGLALYRQMNYPDMSLSAFYGMISAFFVVACIDGYLSWRRPPGIVIKRSHDSNISLDVEQTISLNIDNKTKRIYQLEVTDDIPPKWRQLSPLLSFRLAPLSTQTQNYRIKAIRRGLYQISGTFIRLSSQMGLWKLTWHEGTSSQIRVFPNFSAISDLSGLNGSLNLTEAGLKKFNKRGTGMDFNQLRDYREGDSIRQIDWAATGRFNKPISREYQEEKNQNITVLLDSGKRMCVQDDELSYFDHALNALILLSYTALKNGDQLSFMSFGETSRWLPKVKGARNVSQVINHFFDLYPDTGASDYLTAAQTLMQKQHKRSLVLLVTCLRDEDFSDLVEACRLMQQKHLVAVISITEPVYQAMRKPQVTSFEQALAYSSAAYIEQKVKKRLSLLQYQGVICFQVETSALNARVINTYLSVKKGGLL